MSGGAGNDTYLVDNGSDVVTENLNEGIDTVQSSITYIQGANVENLTLTGTAAINGSGNALDNVLTGNSADNTLDGGIGADTVLAGISFVLCANEENLTLSGTAANGTGNAFNNSIIGNAGDNVIDGAVGADTMSGGAGNDTYIVDNTNDVVTENLGEGTDTVQSSLTYTLGANFENLTLTGSNAINGTGNALYNILSGNSAFNTLIGGAG